MSRKPSFSEQFEELDRAVRDLGNVIAKELESLLVWGERQARRVPWWRPEEWR